MNFGSYVGEYVGDIAAKETIAAQYGISAGSEQAAMLAASEAGLQTASDIARQIAGSSAGAGAAAVVKGQDPVKAMLTGGVSAAVPAVLGQVSGFTALPNTAQQVIKNVVTTELLGGNVSSALISSVVRATRSEEHTSELQSH